MGWTSTYTPYAPTTAQRKEDFINELTFSNDKVDSVALKATMRGSTGYALQKVIHKDTGEETIYSVAMLTSYGDNEYAVKFVDPILFYNNFPITWVSKITPRDKKLEDAISTSCYDVTGFKKQYPHAYKDALAHAKEVCDGEDVEVIADELSIIMGIVERAVDDLLKY